MYIPTRILALTLFLTASVAQAQTTAFTYQGRLQENGSGVTGVMDFEFRLFTALSGGVPFGPVVTRNDLGVTNGLFTVGLDFGAAPFDGGERFLDISVRPGASAGTYTNLAPRQPITATPYAMRALNAGTATSVAAGGVNSAALANDAVNGAKILNGSITSAELNVSLLQGTFWNLGGNAGTTPGLQFLGTTDNSPLEFKVNGARALRLEPNANGAPNVIGGSPSNRVTALVEGATIAGGGLSLYPNTITASYATIGGGTFNTVAGGWATIGGGRDNNVMGSHSTVAGGFRNTIQTNADFVTIGGGKINQATVNEATVAGGAFNSALAFSATIGGGGGNAASGEWSTIAGGRDNVLTNANYATVGGGLGNVIKTNAAFSTIPGGLQNEAGGVYAFAAGRRAKASHAGAFVWADAADADFLSTADNQFLIRAAGGVGINTNNPQGAALAVNGNVRVNGVIAGDGSGLTNLSLLALNSADPIDVVNAAPLASPLQYPTGGTLPSSVAAGDVNGDGRADLAVANAGSGNVTILINTGPGFVLAGTIAARAGAGAVLLADINRDGRLDVLCANGDNSIAVARGSGNGSFNAATFHASTPTLTRIAVGDLNGDTWPDLVAGARNASVIPVFLNNGAGNFPANPSSLLPTAANPNAVALADVNGDSRLDLVTAHGAQGTAETSVAVYPGNGSGGFAAPINIGTGNGFKTLAVLDMNRDGLKDIVVGMGQSSARIDIFTNSGPGSFTLHQTLPTTYILSLTTGDFNLDGWPDVAVNDGGFFGYTGMRMMLSDGAGRLAPGFHLTPFPYPSVAAGDLNGDGRSELVVPNGGDPGLVNVYSVQTIPGVALSGPTILRGPVTIEQPAAFSAGFTAAGPSTFSSGFTAGGPSAFSSSLTIGGELSFGSTTRQMINLWGTEYGLGVQSGTHYFRTGAGSTDKFAWYRGGVHSHTSLDPGAGGALLMSLEANRLFVNSAVGLGTPNPAAKLHLYSADNPAIMRIQSAGGFGAGRIEFLSDPQGAPNEWRPGYIQSTDNGGFTGGLSFVVNGSGGGNLFTEIETMRIVNGRVGIGTATPASALQVVGTVTATAFNPPSDRNLKENFVPVCPQQVLEKVAALSISRWNFKGDAATPHVGPMAQDFHAAFGLGTDDKHIATVDADGVALAAIQGLNQKLEEKESRLQALEQELAVLKELVARLAQPRD